MLARPCWASEAVVMMSLQALAATFGTALAAFNGFDAHRFI
jgi:hypothetical protein